VWEVEDRVAYGWRQEMAIDESGNTGYNNVRSGLKTGYKKYLRNEGNRGKPGLVSFGERRFEGRMIWIK